jgi:CoA:oxalate CoA-transferase
VQGILAALHQRSSSGRGMHVEVNLLESALDFQFEVLTTHLNDGGRLPERSRANNAHAYLGAPYGVYETSEGYLALAMGSVPRLGALLGCDTIQEYREPESWFAERDEIKRRLAEHLRAKPAREWAKILEEADYWCAVLQTLDELLLDEGFQSLGLLQEVACEDGSSRKATRCPIRIDGEKLLGRRGISLPGRDTMAIDEEFQL